MRRSAVRNRLLTAALAAYPLCAMGSSAHADVLWNVTSGYWSTPSNWFLGYVPTSAADATFEPRSGTDVVSFNASAAINSISVFGGNAQFDLSGQTLTIGGSGNAFNVIGANPSPAANVIVDGGTVNLTTASAEIYAGGNGTGYLTIQDGAVINTSNGYLNAGDNGTTGSGVISVTGAGTTVNVGNAYAGASAIGTLNVSSGATINTGGFTVGAEATGYANVGNGVSTSTVNASNGTIALGGFVTVDKGQTGLLSINTGGLVIANQTIVWNSNSQIHLAGGYLKTGQLNLSGGSYSRFNWGAGTVELTSSDAQFGQTASPYNTFGSSTYSLVNGESLNVSGSGHEIDVGVNTTGELDLSSGASIAAGHLQLGYSSNGTGTMKMDGAATVSNTAITYVGLSGSGYLQMTNGATLDGSNVLLGANPGASGTINLSSGSSITLTGTGQISVGGYIQTAGGSGSLIINGGTVTTPGPTQVWNNGSISLVSGNFSTGSLAVSSPGNGVHWTGGTLALTVSDMSVDSYGPLGSSVALNNGMTLQTTNAHNISIGANTYATLTVNSGGSVQSANNITLGASPFANGTLNLTGTNATATAGGSLIVGNGPGTGYATINNGASLSTATDVQLAPSTGNGSLTIGSSNSSISTLSTPNLWIGGTCQASGGAGTVTINTGAIVNITGTTKIWNATSSLNLTGGTFNTSSFLASGGNSSITGGTFNTGSAALTGGNLSVNAGTVSLGALNVSAGVYNQTGGTVSVASVTAAAASPSSVAASFNWTGGTLKVTGSNLTVGNSAARAWGYNEYGQLGNGTYSTVSPYGISSPVAVTRLSSGVTAIAGGADHSLAVQNGAVYAWGYDYDGELGNGNYNNSNIPVAVSGLTSGVTAIAGGGHHSLAVQNGAVYAWGYNGFGELGNGNNSDSNVPVAVTGLSSGVTAIAGGGDHSLAVQNGAVYAWGYNVYGELGNGNYNSSNVPLAVSGLTSGVTAIAGGDVHSMAVQNGAVYAWGNNYYGQLGNGNYNNSNVPVAVTGLSSGVTAIAGGGLHSLALQNGAVYAWGYNYYGQLGNGNYNNSNVPVAVGGITGTIVAVAAGDDSSYALSADGSIWDWGYNGNGELGLGNTTSNFDTPQHLLPPTGYAYTSINSGADGDTAVATLAQIVSGSSLATNLTINSSMALQVTGSGQGINLIGTLAQAGGSITANWLNVSGGTFNRTSGAFNVPIINQTGGNFINTGTLQLAGAGATVTTFNLAGGTLTATTLTVGAVGALNWTGGNLQLTGGGSTFGGPLTIPATGQLIVDGTVDLPGGNLATLWSQVRQGYNAGNWQGSGGITSAAAAADTSHLTALAIIQNSTNQNASGPVLYTGLDGYTFMTAGDVLLKRTYYGDTNLDGQVTSSDYSRIDNGYLSHLTGWYNGDFNYDNTINGSDYTLIDNAFNQQGAQIASQIAPTSAVPEPASLGLLAVGGVALLGRRRRVAGQFESGEPGRPRPGPYRGEDAPALQKSI